MKSNVEYALDNCAHLHQGLRVNDSPTIVQSVERYGSQLVAHHDGPHDQPAFWAIYDNVHRIVSQSARDGRYDA